jgi:hydroxymethylbilane synthase
MEKLILATRSSPLALWQANSMKSRLEHSGFKVELMALETIGDKKLEVSLSKIGDKGVFTQELEDLLRIGAAHIAVHSAKDLPSKLPEDLEILAFSERENPCDVLVSTKPGLRLENQPLVIGTSSTRRVAILKRYFPDIETVTIRGNLQTRFRKMEEGQCQGLLLAYAGVQRMGFSGLIRQELDLNVFTPAVGQGALAIEVSKELPSLLKQSIRKILHHHETGMVLEAERAFLRKMDGGCSVPVFGYARFYNGDFHISGGIVSLDGQEEIRKELVLSAPQYESDYLNAAGQKLAEDILQAGGEAILQKIKQNLQP